MAKSTKTAAFKQDRSLARFLIELSINATFRAQFEANPVAAMSQFNLSEVARNAVTDANREEIVRRVISQQFSKGKTAVKKQQKASERTAGTRKK
jgi:hypothetical protein